MSRIRKTDVRMIAKAIKSGPGKFKLNTGWTRLCEEFGIGTIETAHVEFSRADLKTWRDLVSSSLGFDPLGEKPEGDRISVSKITPDEKWAGEVVQKWLVSLTSFNGDLILIDGRSSIIESVEYRLDWRRIDTAHYKSIIVIENFKAYLSTHRFKFPDLDNALVLYRGHDHSAKEVINFLDEINGSLPVYLFTDPDPAGIGIIIDSQFASHVICPDIKDLHKENSVSYRFEKQIGHRPGILSDISNCTDSFSQYASHIVNQGIAISQEWLCSHDIPLVSMPLRDS